ncbi:MAG: hypothetical protein M1480_06630 [Bacteroidetes bacterium]|nr:hypothetical protein [Bacteroidota bacterium]
MNRLFNFDMELNKNIPVLIDFDGVIRLGNKPASDALEFLTFLHDKNILFFIITNSTQNTSNDIKNYLKRIGVDFKVNAMTTVDATLEYLKEKNLRVSVYCKKNIKKKFAKYIDDINPQAVVIGGKGILVYTARLDIRFPLTQKFPLNMKQKI